MTKKVDGKHSPEGDAGHSRDGSGPDRSRILRSSTGSHSTDTKHNHVDHGLSIADAVGSHDGRRERTHDGRSWLRSQPSQYLGGKDVHNNKHGGQVRTHKQS